mmetsp:Transcript_110977/g.353570  ORF Transcript_110977/g.353570 Transcript_110977/m.353570 type:complete len:347 (-) Transcript_110977:786-1826(-)
MNSARWGHNCLKRQRSLVLPALPSSGTHRWTPRALNIRAEADLGGVFQQGRQTEAGKERKVAQELRATGPRGDVTKSSNEQASMRHSTRTHVLHFQVLRLLYQVLIDCLFSRGHLVLRALGLRILPLPVEDLLLEVEAMRDVLRPHLLHSPTLHIVVLLRGGLRRHLLVPLLIQCPLPVPVPLGDLLEEEVLILLPLGLESVDLVSLLLVNNVVGRIQLLHHIFLRIVLLALASGGWAQDHGVDAPDLADGWLVPLHLVRQHLVELVDLSSFFLVPYHLRLLRIPFVLLRLQHNSHLVCFRVRFSRRQILAFSLDVFCCTIHLFEILLKLCLQVKVPLLLVLLILL